MARLDYSKFSKHKLELRDYLALERTILSNERTLLSYLQNALAIGVTGMTSIYATDSVYFQLLGIILLVVACIVVVVGTIKFKAVKGRLDNASPAETAAVAVEEMSSSQTKK